MDKLLIHRLPLITGASSGIGAVIAGKFSNEGIRVILDEYHQEKFSDLANQIQSTGGIASYYFFDLTSSDARAFLVTKIEQKIGIPDILVNNAGIG